jgi:hypothetical protein
MQKVYLLLRNNQQTGPYSFEELLQFQLKPQDLIWVEGRSYGWRYPTEIETLKPYLPAPTETVQKAPPARNGSETIIPSFQDSLAAKKIFVRMPVSANRPAEQKESIDPIEQKAEELRKRVQAFTPPAETVKTNYTRDLHEAEEDYTKWVYQKKTKKKTFFNPTRLTLGITIVLMAFGGWLVVSKFIKSSPEPIITSLNKTDQPQNNSIDETRPADNNYLPEKDVSSPPSFSVEKKEKNQKQDKTKSEIKTQETVFRKETAITQNDVTQEPSTENSIEEEKQKEIIAETPAEKKKTFKDKISELFKRKKTDEPIVEQESSSVDNNNNERKATRRGEENETAPVMTDVSKEVEIKTNKIADSWMMGVKGLKLTLYNSSSLTISSARVEVLYYSDNNDLLEKKILSYSNIPPKKSQTVAAPDQRLADHIEYKILSATGIENAYANR